MAQILQFPQYVQKRFSSGRAAFDILKVFKSKSELGTIYIDLNAGLTGIKSADDLAKYAMLRTFAHEFTHFIEKWNPIQYAETLTDRDILSMAKRDAIIGYYYRAYITFYAKDSRGIGERDVYTEIIRM